MEWGSSSQRLKARTGSPYPCPGGYFWRFLWIGELHAESQPDFPALISLPHLKSRSLVCLTRHRSSSTRTHVSGFHLAFSRGTHVPTGLWTLPVLSLYRSLLVDLPHQTPKSSGECYSVRTCQFPAFHALSTTIHSSPFHYSLRPCRLYLLSRFL